MNKLTRPSSLGKKALDVLVFRSWWVLLFFGACYLCYSQAMQKKKEAYQELSGRLLSLQNEKEVVLEAQKDLLLQINSQSDPAWIEMTLMKGLGLVPEGQLKVFFEKPE